MKRLLRDFTVALMAGVAGSALWALIAGKAHSIDHLPYAAGSRYAQSSTGIIICVWKLLQGSFSQVWA
jgi:hypothetical protein